MWFTPCAQSTRLPAPVIADDYRDIGYPCAYIGPDASFRCLRVSRPNSTKLLLGRQRRGGVQFIDILERGLTAYAEEADK